MLEVAEGVVGVLGLEGHFPEGSYGLQESNMGQVADVVVIEIKRGQIWRTSPVLDYCLEVGQRGYPVVTQVDFEQASKHVVQASNVGDLVATQVQILNMVEDVELLDVLNVV